MKREQSKWQELKKCVDFLLKREWIYNYETYQNEKMTLLLWDNERKILGSKNLVVNPHQDINPIGMPY